MVGKIIREEMMHWNTLPIDHILFTNVDPKTGENITIDVTALSADMKTKLRPRVTVPIDPVWAKDSLNLRGIEQHRLKRLIPVVHKLEPVLFLFMPDGTHLLVDGNHRYVVRWMCNYKNISARLIPASIWKKYVVTGFPDASSIELNKQFSGIL